MADFKRKLIAEAEDSLNLGLHSAARCTIARALVLLGRHSDRWGQAEAIAIIESGDSTDFLISEAKRLLALNRQADLIAEIDNHPEIWRVFE